MTVILQSPVNPTGQVFGRGRMPAHPEDTCRHIMACLFHVGHPVTWHITPHYIENLDIEYTWERCMDRRRVTSEWVKSSCFCLQSSFVVWHNNWAAAVATAVITLGLQGSSKLSSYKCENCRERQTSKQKETVTPQCCCMAPPRERVVGNHSRCEANY